MALRLALGASPGALMELVVFEALALSAVGLLAGLLVFWTFTGALRPLLFGVGAADPVSLLLVVTTLLTVTLGAALLPARAAAKVDSSVLKAE